MLSSYRHAAQAGLRPYPVAKNGAAPSRRAILADHVAADAMVDDNELPSLGRAKTTTKATLQNLTSMAAIHEGTITQLQL